MIKRDAWHLQTACSWVLGLALTMWATSASAKWYVVVGTLPNNVEVVDTTTNKVVKTFPAPEQSLSFAFSPDGKRIYAFCIVWNDLWKVDYKTKKREAVATLANSQAVPLIHPDGKKLYCGGQWHSLNVYDTETLKHITDVELGHSMAASGMRFIRSDKDL